MASVTEDFIGSGIIFPFVINEFGRVDTTTGFPLIEASIIQILSWPKGRKFFDERFGARLFELLEEPSDLITKTLARTFVTEAIARYETRIKLVKIKVTETRDDNRFDMEITYQIRNSKVTNSFIYPFYKEIIY